MHHPFGGLGATVHYSGNDEICVGPFQPKVCDKLSVMSDACEPQSIMARTSKNCSFFPFNRTTAVGRVPTVNIEQLVLTLVEQDTRVIIVALRRCRLLLVCFNGWFVSSFFHLFLAQECMMSLLAVGVSAYRFRLTSFGQMTRPQTIEAKSRLLSHVTSLLHWRLLKTTALIDCVIFGANWAWKLLNDVHAFDFPLDWWVFPFLLHNLTLRIVVGRFATKSSTGLERIAFAFQELHQIVKRRVVSINDVLCPLRSQPVIQLFDDQVDEPGISRLVFFSHSFELAYYFIRSGYELSQIRQVWHLDYRLVAEFLYKRRNSEFRLVVMLDQGVSYLFIVSIGDSVTTYKTFRFSFQM